MAFSIAYTDTEQTDQMLLNADKHLNFVAPNEKDFEMWVDALNVLIGKEMDTRSASKDVEMLLSLKLKVRMVELGSNIPIPSTTPRVPPPPENFDFVYR